MDLGLKQLHSAFASGGSSGRSPPAGAHGAAAPCPGAARRPAAPVTAAHGRRPSNPSLPSAASSKPTNSCSYTRPRAALCPPPCSTAAPGSNPTSPVTSPPTLPPIPAALLQDEASARASWIDRCLNNPLTDPTTNSRIHIYGIPHFAPYGGPKGLHELQQLLTAVQPTILAIEQPYDVAARAGLPYPETVRQLLSLLPPPTDNDALADPALAEAVLAQLPQLSRPARVGRDMLDPFEVLGLYPGLDVAVRGEQLAEAGRRFGFVPGLEYAALVAAAEDAGAQVGHAGGVVQRTGWKRAGKEKSRVAGWGRRVGQLVVGCGGRVVAVLVGLVLVECTARWAPEAPAHPCDAVPRSPPHGIESAQDNYLMAT